MQATFDDPYFHTRLRYAVKGREFLFDTAFLLFSPQAIDAGTAFLLKSMVGGIGRPSSILELGCSYGAIGIVLASFNEQASVVMGDKDLLAVRYAGHNSKLNGTQNTTVVGSIGIEKIPPQPFDLIVSNLPSKIGDRAIEYDFIVRPCERLSPGGSYWLVADSQLNRLIPLVARRHKLHLAEIGRHARQIVYRIKQS